MCADIGLLPRDCLSGCPVPERPHGVLFNPSPSSTLRSLLRVPTANNPKCPQRGPAGQALLSCPQDGGRHLRSSSWGLWLAATLVDCAPCLRPSSLVSVMTPSLRLQAAPIPSHVPPLPDSACCLSQLAWCRPVIGTPFCCSGNFRSPPPPSSLFGCKHLPQSSSGCPRMSPPVRACF